MEDDKEKIIDQINTQIELHEYHKESLYKIKNTIDKNDYLKLFCNIRGDEFQDYASKGKSFFSHDKEFNHIIINTILEKLDERIKQLNNNKKNIDNYIKYERIKYLRELINSKQYEIGIINNFIAKAKEVNIELYDDKHNNETLNDDKSLLLYLLEKRKQEIEKASNELLELQNAIRMDKQS